MDNYFNGLSESEYITKMNKAFRDREFMDKIDAYLACSPDAEKELTKHLNQQGQ